MMIQEIKRGMKVCNAGGDVFEINGAKGDLVLVELLKHNSSFILVNHIHETFTPGKILEIDQTSETETFAGYCEVALEYLEPVEEVEEIEIPMFDKGDIVKDKFGNLYVIEDLVSPQQLEQDSPEYDHMGYRLKIIEKNPSSPARKVGNVSGFHSDDACMWIYNTFGDAVNDEVLVTDAHIFATELELYDEEDADDVEEIGVSDVPIFLVGDLVKDKFGNVFEVMETKELFEFIRGYDYQPFGYRLKLVSKEINHPNPKIYDDLEFIKLGDTYWIYNTANDIHPDEYSGTLEHHIFAADLQSVESDRVTPAKPAKAEIAKRYPSIEDLQKISEENDLGKLLDQAYEILKEQALQGERRSNLEAEKFKRCIPHFEREGFDITEHGMLIEVRW